MADVHRVDFDHILCNAHSRPSRIIKNLKISTLGGVMTVSIFRAFAIISALIPGTQLAADFDCKNASLASDYVICSSSNLIGANSQLAKAWISSPVCQ
jgi:hypothetical protein